MESVLTGWWRRRPPPARFDLYTRASLYLISGAEPLFAASLAGTPGLEPAAQWTVLTLALAHTAACVLLLRAGFAHGLGRRARPDLLIGIAGAMSVAGLAVSYPLLAGVRSPGNPADLTVGALALFAGPYLAALSTAVPVRVTMALGAAAVAVMVPTATAAGSPHPVAAAVAAALGLTGAVVAYRCSVWMLAVVWELDRARQAQSRLAVAEERLRFARDLHDVVGRNLSVVALKSELAAQLAKRGRAEAVDEMLEVHRIARDSLAELREVVRGYRTADLDAELAGARAVLTSAGVACRVIGDAHALPVQVQGLLGWVVREGITNVLRHSEARTCSVTLRRELTDEGTSVVLSMENDGVPDGGGPSGGEVPAGSGLLGLTERLAPLGGTVEARRQAPDRFRLTARLRLPAQAEESV
ncbi:MAG TPA: histidine kinase [Catenuloplanes sp.]